MEIVELKIGDITPYANNPVKHDDINELVASIKAFGFRIPIIIDSNNVIVCGHGRLMAAKKLKMETVPCIYASDLSEEQIKAFRLADNKVAEFAEWDIGKLTEELDGILDLDMEQFGFDLSLDDEEPEAVEDDYNEELPEEPKAKLGDIYQLGRHRLMCGDSTILDHVEKLVGGVSNGYAYHRSSLQC